jgi:hypothetical protein
MGQLLSRKDALRTCEYDGEPFSAPRSHPWTDGLDVEARYHDFTSAPELIRTSLEDFKPFDRYPAVEDFYALLARINHPKSPLESNDCAFTGPGPNQSTQNASALECSGRLMLLFRELEQNTSKARVASMRLNLHQALAEIDPGFASGIIGTTLVPVRYLALPPDAQLGEQLLLSFWSFGGSDAGVFQNLSRLIKNLSRALRSVSSRLAAA